MLTAKITRVTSSRKWNVTQRLLSNVMDVKDENSASMSRVKHKTKTPSPTETSANIY